MHYHVATIFLFVSKENWWIVSMLALDAIGLAQALKQSG